MSLSTSRQAYADCYEVFDAAMENDAGVKVKMQSEDAAYFFRMRMHQARSLVKKDNSRIYPDDHPLYGASEYDRLAVKIRKLNGDFYIWVEPHGVQRGEIEPIGAEDVAEQVLETTEDVKQVVVQKIARRI